MSSHERLARLEAKFANLGRAKERAEATRQRVLPVASGSGGPKLQIAENYSAGRKSIKAKVSTSQTPTDSTLLEPFAPKPRTP